MNEAVPGIQERFDLLEGEIKAGDVLLCERVSKTEWWFVNPFGWRIRTLPEGTEVSVQLDQSHVPPGFKFRKADAIVGTITNHPGVSLVRRSSTEIQGKWYHDDLKFWDGDTVTIISLPNV